MLLAGGITLTVAVVAGLAALMGETDLAARLPGFATLFAVGLGLTGSAVLRLPGWARRRQSQMEGIAERAVLMAASDSVEPTSEED